MRSTFEIDFPPIEASCAHCGGRDLTVCPEGIGVISVTCNRCFTEPYEFTEARATRIVRSDGVVQNLHAQLYAPQTGEGQSVTRATWYRRQAIACWWVLDFLRKR